MKQFKTPVAMKVTVEQYHRDLEEPLEKLGYVWKSSMSPEEDFTKGDEYLCTNYVMEKSSLGGLPGLRGPRWGVGSGVWGYIIETYNPKLFLALAGMTEGDIPIVGEYVRSKEGGYPLRKVTVLCSNGSIKYMGTNPGHYSEDYYRKATKKELIQHFTKGEVKVQTSYIYADPPSERKIKWFKVIKAPKWSQSLDRHLRWQGDRGMEIGSITWQCEDTIADKILRPENNRHLIDFDSSCFKEIPDPRIKTVEEQKGMDGDAIYREACKRYPIGTTVKSLGGTLPTEIILEHTDFRWFFFPVGRLWFNYNNGTQVLVYRDGKWANVIKAAVEEKETNLEKAKRLYPIGTKFISAIRPKSNTPNLVNKGIYKENYGNIFADGNSVYSCGSWAKIVENKPTPLKWYCKVTKDNLELAREWQRLQKDWIGWKVSVKEQVLSKHHCDKSYYYGSFKNLTKEYPVKYDDYVEISTSELREIVEKKKFTPVKTSEGEKATETMLRQFDDLSQKKLDLTNPNGYYAETVEEARMLCEEAHRQGYKWYSGSSYLKTSLWYAKYVYYIKKGTWSYDDKEKGTILVKDLFKQTIQSDEIVSKPEKSPRVGRTPIEVQLIEVKKRF